MIYKNIKVLNDCRGMDADEIFNTVLKQRNINDINEFLYPSSNYLLPLNSLKYINKAYELLMDHIKRGSKIGILWDTDTDGVASGAIVTRYLYNIIPKNNIECFINKGKEHGLIGQNLNKFTEINLLVIVDSLDKDESQYKILKESGVDIIVLDHHAIDSSVDYDSNITLVSSQRDYANPHLSGSGVVWKFCKYVDYHELTDYANDFVDLAACGLVADMVDMSVMENRYIVSMGLNNLINPAIKKIVGSFEFNSTAISFSVAPLINAANRMFENESAMRLFLADENKEVLKYKKELVQCKERQNEEVSRLLPNILMACENQVDKKMIISTIDSFYGISGLIGNKLLEKYNRPILVLKDKTDKLSGSMRAIGVVDFRKICNDSGLAEANGHELASGIDIMKENLNEFIAYIETALSSVDFIAQDNIVDIQINVEDLTRDLVNKIKIIDKVSGSNFKPVRFYISSMKHYEISDFSNFKHLVIKPEDDIYVIEWNTDKNFIEMEDHSLCEDYISCICTLDNGFFGRKFCLKAICDEIWVEDDN